MGNEESHFAITNPMEAQPYCINNMNENSLYPLLEDQSYVHSSEGKDDEVEHDSLTSKWSQLIAIPRLSNYDLN